MGATKILIKILCFERLPVQGYVGIKSAYLVKDYF